MKIKRLIIIVLVMASPVIGVPLGYYAALGITGFNYMSILLWSVAFVFTGITCSAGIFFLITLPIACKLPWMHGLCNFKDLPLLDFLEKYASMILEYAKKEREMILGEKD